MSVVKGSMMKANLVARWRFVVEVVLHPVYLNVRYLARELRKCDSPLCLGALN
jgi:hypothetical protein